MAKEIPLTRGATALVDDVDYDWLLRYRWCVSGKYAAARINGKCVYMHRLIMDAPHGMGVDHINGDVFDNRRCNLRLASQRENSRNQKPHGAHRKYKGVYWREDTHKWQVKITVDYKSINLGCFSNEEIAATAYDVAARIYFGEFARTNFDWSRGGR